MNRPLDIASRPQLALQNYLDALLYDATEELQVVESVDEFQAAVLEEQAHDARMRSAVAAAVAAALPVPQPAPMSRPAPVSLAYSAQPEPAAARVMERPVVMPPVILPPAIVPLVEPVVDVHLSA